MIRVGKISTILIIISLLSVACNRVEKIDVELDLYNDILNDLVSVDYGLIPVKPPPGNKGDSIKYLEKLKDYYTMIDTTVRIIYVFDSLVSLDSTAVLLAYNIFTDINCDFSDYIQKQKVREVQNSRHFDVAQLEFDDVKLIPIQSTNQNYNEVNRNNYLELGHLLVSRVIFDSYYKNALLSFSYFCKNQCGYGQYIHLQRVNGVWKIHERFSDWVI